MILIGIGIIFIILYFLLLKTEIENKAIKQVQSQQAIPEKIPENKVKQQQNMGDIDTIYPPTSPPETELSSLFRFSGVILSVKQQEIQIEPPTGFPVAHYTLIPNLETEYIDRSTEMSVKNQKEIPRLTIGKKIYITTNGEPIEDKIVPVRIEY